MYLSKKSVNVETGTENFRALVLILGLVSRPFKLQSLN